MRQTSLEAFKSIKDMMNKKQMAVYGALCSKPMTNDEISKELHWPINCVTPRTKELVEKNLIKYSGTKISGYTRRRHIIWKVVNQEEANQMKFI